MAAEARFRAMGSDVHVVVIGGDAPLLEMAEWLVDDLEARWSRFRPDSEVSRLNDRAGRPVPVSPETMRLVRRAVEGARVTGGAVQPDGARGRAPGGLRPQLRA